MSNKFKRYGIPVREENTPIFKGVLNKIETIETDVGTLDTNKADKVTTATNGDIATLDSNGNLVDSGKKITDFLPIRNEGNIVYINAQNGNPAIVGYSPQAIQNTIPLRAANGVIRVGTPSDNADATPKQYVDTHPAVGVQFTTTAPTEDNADNYIKIVVLTEEPQTRYNGYLYIIQPSPTPEPEPENTPE